MKRLVILAALLPVLTACGQTNTKPTSPSTSPTMASVIRTVCNVANDTRPALDALSVMGKLTPKGATDLAAAEAFLWPAAPAGPLCNGQPYPTTLTTAQFGQLISMAALLAGVN